MRTLLPLLLAAWASLAHAAGAATERPTADGTWHWTFRMPDGSEIRPKVRLKQEGAALTGTTSHRAGTETAITNGVVDGDVVSFDVIRQAHGETNLTRYSGRRTGDAIRGTATTSWGGSAQSYPWEATRHSGIDGTWKWKVLFRDRPIEIRVHLKQDGETLTGGMPGFGRRETPVKNGTFKNGEVHFEVERGRDDNRTVQKFTGKLDGDTIKGEVENDLGDGPETTEWIAQRAE